MNWILVVVLAGHILTAGTTEEVSCMGAAASLQQKQIAAVCVAAPVLATIDNAPAGVWML